VSPLKEKARERARAQRKRRDLADIDSVLDELAVDDPRASRATARRSSRAGAP
jgi:hypothetical protein